MVGSMRQANVGLVKETCSSKLAPRAELNLLKMPPVALFPPVWIAGKVHEPMFVWRAEAD
jgi:hypothetical protein